MGIIATVGRRSLGVMTLIGAMYALLIVGGVTMVYPFLLMLSTATTTPSDMQEYRVIPAYWHDDNALYRKFLWLRYDTGRAGEAAMDYNLAYFPGGAQVSSFRLDEFFGWGDPDAAESLGIAEPPADRLNPDDPDVRARADDLDRFLREAPFLWPGPPLTVNPDQAGPDRRRPTLVTDPFGRPGDPRGITTGLGNRYRTVGYIGSAFTGLSGVGRDQWTEFLNAYYLNRAKPDESDGTKLQRLIDRQGRPYELYRQVPSGYDMPRSPSWNMIPGDYQQMDWMLYKAAWTSGAPIELAGSDRPGILPETARQFGDDPDAAGEYTDALGRTSRWSRAHDLRALRPTQFLPEFWRTLKNRYMTIDALNVALGLTRRLGKDDYDRGGRDVVAAGRVNVPAPGGGRAAVAESSLGVLLRMAVGGGRPATTPDEAPTGYLLPPRVDEEWARLAGPFGLNAAAIQRLNRGVERRWVAALRVRGRRVVRLDPLSDFTEAYASDREPIYPPMAAEWRYFVANKAPGAMIVWVGRDPTAPPPPDGQTGEGVAGAAGVEEKMQLDYSRRQLRLTEHAWRDFLRLVYKDREEEFRRLYLPGMDDARIADATRRGADFYGPGFDEYALARMPIADRDVLEFRAHKGELRRHFVFGNFAVVLDDLVLEGRAMFNTIILIVLAIGTHVTVNPFAAYALSRFRLKYTYKVLLFMLATMAFPPAVGMIPGFLLLKHLGLINTYAALVLPSIASGYTIFLLKGFFDALPQELYEAAEIDGAGKVTTFMNVTFPLSKPIFAIITLQSFTAAYSGFMWAFLICPDQKMWTIMVHLFNIQQTNQAPIAMAALVIAALPTFLVFLFCQNVILRGIIIPSFK